MPSRGELSGQEWSNVVFTSHKQPTPPRQKQTPHPQEDDAQQQHKRVTHELKSAIMQARCAKGLTQKELGMQMQCDAKTIQMYETGRTIPNNAFIAKLERTLGAKLPRV